MNARNTTGKWLNYLALSACANILIVHMINIESMPNNASQIPSALKVNLMALSTAAMQPLSKPAPVPQRQNRQKAADYTDTETEHQYPKQAKRLQEQRHLKPVTKDSTKTPMRQANKAVTALKQDTDQPVADRLTPKQEVVSASRMPDPVRKMDSKKLLGTTSPASPFKRSETIKRTTDVIQQARYRRRFPPVYPRRSLELGQQGMVTLHAEVLPNGFPDELKVAESSGYRLLDMAALAAVKKWEFEPTTVNGSAVISWVRVPVHFVIKDN